MASRSSVVSEEEMLLDDTYYDDEIPPSPKIMQRVQDAMAEANLNNRVQNIRPAAENGLRVIADGPAIPQPQENDEQQANEYMRPAGENQLPHVNEPAVPLQLAANDQQQQTNDHTVARRQRAGRRYQVWNNQQRNLVNLLYNMADPYRGGGRGKNQKKKDGN